MTEENLTTINYLTEEQYNTAKANGEIKENELYMTPDDEGGTSTIPNSRNLWCMPEGKTSNGVTFTVNKDGSMNIKGTSSTSQNWGDVSSSINNPLHNIVSGKTYTLTTNQPLPDGVTIFIGDYNGSTWISDNLILSSTHQTLTKVLNLTGTRVAFIIRVLKGYTVDISNLKIYLTEETKDKIQVADALNNAWLAINSLNAILQKSFICCQMTGNAVSYSAGTEYNAVWNGNVSSKGDGIAKKSNNYEFEIKKGIKFVKVNAQLWFQLSTNTGSIAKLYIYKNNVLVSSTNSNSINIQWGRVSAVANNIFVPVTKGDVLKIKYKVDGSNGTVGEGKMDNQCWFSIEEV